MEESNKRDRDRLSGLADKSREIGNAADFPKNDLRINITRAALHLAALIDAYLKT